MIHPRSACGAFPFVALALAFCIHAPGTARGLVEQ